jgi:hypothetical protein
LPDPSLKLVLIVAFLVCAGSLHTQGFPSASKQTPPVGAPANAALPSAHSGPAPHGSSFSNAQSPDAGWKSPYFDAFKPVSRSSGYSGMGGGIGFVSSGRAVYADEHGFGGSVPGGAPTDLAALFLGSSGSSRGLRFGSPGAQLGAPRNFDPLRRNRADLRLNSSPGDLRLSYRAIFNSKAPSMGGGFGSGPAAATFTTSNYTNGMFHFSAPATYGGHPITGSFGMVRGSASSTPGGQKHSGPSVALKLSF